MATRLTVGPGELHRCATAALQAEVSGGVTCQLLPGVYRESLEILSGTGPLEIVGAGPGLTELRGDAPLSGLDWTLSPRHNSGGIYWATLPPGELRTPGVQQAFLDDEWLPEARYPNTDIHKVLKLTSWGFCGKGSAHGYCKDRPDAWSDLAKQHVNWTGALATLSLGTRYATWTRRVTQHTKSSFHYYPGSLGPGPGTADAAKPGGRYFLSGVLGALDSPGEFFIDEDSWTAYVWARDSQPPAARASLKVRSFCVDTARAGVTLANLSFFGCTFRLRNCSACRVADLNLTYPSYNRDVHLRDVQPFGSGPPPNITLLEGDGNTLERVAIRYSNTAGLKVVGSHNTLSELLIRDTDWLGTLDYPPLEIGFGNDCDSPEIRKANRSGCRDVPPFPGWSVAAAEAAAEQAEAEAEQAEAERAALLGASAAADSPGGARPQPQPQPAGLRMYPRNPHGTNNTVRRCTVANSGNAGIVTSQLSNEVSYCDVHGVGTIGKDDAGLHADNSRAPCGAGGVHCVKEWHHNWVHDCYAKCMRGDDFTKNLSMHHNVVFDCGEPTSDGGGQSFGVVLKGDYNKFYANTVLKTAQADVVLATGEEGPNHFSVIVNNVASRWSGKKGPTPPSPQQKAHGNWGGNVETGVSTGLFVDFDGYDFRPKPSSAAVGKGVLHPPEVDGPSGTRPDAGAYQSSDTAPWRAGCTFSSLCAAGSAPPPPAACDPPGGAGWACRRKSYCGPKESYYFSGQLSLAACSARCEANSSGCRCFDHVDAAGDELVEKAEGAPSPTCRLHASGQDIVTNAVSSYTAYWRNVTH